MNLFRQQKFSIRKFNVGIFSALIATVTFISINPTTASAAEQNQPAQNQPAQPADASAQPNANAGAQANPTAQPAAPANQGGQADPAANQGGQATPAAGTTQPAAGTTQPAGQGNQADPNNAVQAQPGNQAAPANQAGQGNNQETPNNAAPANQTQPANAPAAAQPAAPVAANAQPQDPNANNTGEGSINTTLTFDDPAISTNDNRQDPTVTVTDHVNGYSLINNGKIGFVNSELRRSDMFDKNNPQNYQARGNVAALGRVNANDSTDHGNFNGISKTVNVKPDSELIINFTTMQTNSKQGATNLVIKDAKKNTELATVNVAKTGTAHLFKVPTDADRLDLQFIPDNTAVADASRITTNKDGYKYYSFIDNVGLFSGSHLYVKNRDLAPKATNNKEYTINTEIGNNGNFGASLKADQFKYEVTLPQGVTYVNDSLTTTFPNGNEDSTVLKNMTVNYDQNANKVTFTSQGVTTARGTHTKEVLFPDKSLKLSYKVNVANIDTPKNIDFNEKLTYRTASDVVINNAQPEVTLTADPFSVAVEMNKDALQQQVNSQVDDSHYTTASIAEYNKLKQQADTILNEDANHVETANRASQADIDGLVTKLQAALIDNQAAIAELDAKAQEKVTAAQQSKKVTQDEVAALVTKINNDKNNAIAEINKQTTAQGVTTEKDNGIAVLEQDVITPTVKPQAKQDIIQAVTTRKQQIKKSNASLQDEKDVANDKIGKIETKAIKDIDAATTNAQVEAIKTKAINDINQTAPATTAKAAALEEFDEVVQAQIDQAPLNPDTTNEEVAEAIERINKAKVSGVKAIEATTTAQELERVKNEEIFKIENITDSTQTKMDAYKEVKQAATARKAQNATVSNATDEEVAEANAAVDAAQTEGLHDIQVVKSQQEVADTKAKVLDKINAIQTQARVKPAADREVDNAYNTRKQEIQNSNASTTEEKEAAYTQLDAKKQEARTNLDAANTNSAVTTAKDAAVQKVQQLHANPVKKPSGKTALDQAAADKKTQIEQTPNASQQEINDAKQEVDTVLNQAKTNIDQSSTDDYVDAAVRDGKAKINAVKTFSEYKKDALAKIADAYNAKVNEADNSNASTSSEIAEAKQKLAELKQTADQNVNQATSKDDIEVQIHNDLDNINDYTIPTGKKESATTDLYAYADQKKNNISADTIATQDEKQQAIKQVDQNVQTALESINNGVDNGDVDDALTQGKVTIDAVQVDASVKPKANQAIEAKAEETKESIDQSDQLTAEEKTEALATIKQITDQAKQGITDAATTAEVEKAKAQGLEAFDNIQIDSTEKQKAIEELETALDQIEAGVNVDSDATTEEKEAFTNALEDILSKATEDISDQTTNAEIATVKNSALEQLKAQRINPEVKKNALEAIREVVNKQIEIIKNADADASAKEIARTDLGRYFDRFADKLDKTQTNAEVDELQNVTIPAIEAIVPQKDPNANDTNSGSDNNDATANSNTNATPENTGQPNVTESTDNANADTSSTTTNNHNDSATGETTGTSTNNSSTDDANDKPTANNNSSVDASTDNSATGNGTTDKPAVELTNNGTTDKPATTESTETTSTADRKDNASVNASNQNAEVNNSAESQPINGKVAQPKSENKAKVEKDGRDSTNQSMVESTTETLPSADITEPNVPSNTSKDKEESTSNQTDAGQLKSETNVASNEADKSPSKADTAVSNKPSTSASSETKDKATSTEDSQKADMATADTKDNQAAIGATADVNNKATQNDGANASPVTVSNGSHSMHHDMLKVTNTDKHEAKATSAQQGKENKAKQQAKTLPDTGMSHNDDLPYAELALGAGMAFLIRRFTKKDQQTEE
ncbi:SasC/FmtB family protein [Staphylococcus aureus]|uniref:SasC/FmtB family protein n=1 Tax=Staphylococcus aureus TaxID=1280 RepID=UPI0030CADC32